MLKLIDSGINFNFTKEIPSKTHNLKHKKSMTEKGNFLTEMLTQDRPIKFKLSTQKHQKIQI